MSTTIPKQTGYVYPQAAFINPSGKVALVAATGRACFAYLWESIHGPGAWARNEWVWAVQFKRLAA